MLKVGPVCIPDQLVRTFRLETLQFFNNRSDAIRISGKMMRHAKVIPGFSMHGLKTDGFLKRLGGLGVIPQPGMGQTQTIPGSIDGRPKAYRLGKGACGFLCLPVALEGEAKIEPGLGIFRILAGGLFKPVGTIGQPVSLGGNETESAGQLRARTERIRC